MGANGGSRRLDLGGGRFPRESILGALVLAQLRLRTAFQLLLGQVWGGVLLGEVGVERSRLWGWGQAFCEGGGALAWQSAGASGHVRGGASGRRRGACLGGCSCLVSC